MSMLSETHPEAWRCVHGVRWRLLESYALARQEGLASPIGLVADVRHARAAQLLRDLFLSATPSADHLYAGCVERGALCSALVGTEPRLAEHLFSRGDEPGCWTALVLQNEEVVLSGSWQELISGAGAQASASSRRGRSR